MPNTPADPNGLAPQVPKSPRAREEEDDWDKGSITKTWYRLRASESSAHLRHLEHHCPEDLEKLVVDERRIQKARARLSRDATKKDYLQELQDTFREWRKEACENPDTVVKHSLADRGNTEGPEGNHLKERICQNFDAEKEVNDDDDPSRELKAGVMFFEKCDHGWKGVTYDKGSFPGHGEFPDQKISVHEALNNEEYNPFAPTFDEKVWRYKQSRANRIEQLDYPSQLFAMGVGSSLI